MRTTQRIFPALFLLFLFSSLAAQGRPAAAAKLVPLANSLTAQTGGAAPRDVTLTGTATWLLGASPQTVPVTLTALADGTSEEVYGLPAGTMTEQWRGPDAAATITGRGAKGLVSEAAGGSIASPGFAWFAPALLLDRAASAGWDATDHGAERHDGATAEHVAIWPTPVTGDGPRGLPLAALRQGRRADLYLDPATHLVRAAVFWIRPTGAPGKRAPAHVVLAPEEVRYSGYRAVNGLMIPSRLEVLLGARTIMRISITAAVANSGAAIAALQ